MVDALLEHEAWRYDAAGHCGGAQRGQDPCSARCARMIGRSGRARARSSAANLIAARQPCLLIKQCVVEGADRRVVARPRLPALPNPHYKPPHTTRDHSQHQATRPSRVGHRKRPSPNFRGRFEAVPSQRQAISCLKSAQSVGTHGDHTGKCTGYDRDENDGVDNIASGDAAWHGSRSARWLQRRFRH